MLIERRGRARLRQGVRLRHRQGDRGRGRPGPDADHPGAGVRDARVHVARAGARRGDRRARRPVLRGGHPLPAADRRHPVPGRDAHGHHQPPPVRGAPPAERAPPRPAVAEGGRRHRHAGPREGSRASVSERARLPRRARGDAERDRRSAHPAAAQRARLDADGPRHLGRGHRDRGHRPGRRYGQCAGPGRRAAGASPRDRIRASPEGDRAERGRSRLRGLRLRGGADSAPAPRAAPGEGDRTGHHHADGPARAGRRHARAPRASSATDDRARTRACGERAGAAAGGADSASGASTAGPRRPPPKRNLCRLPPRRSDRDGGDAAPGAGCRSRRRRRAARARCSPKPTSSSVRARSPTPARAAKRRSG